MALATLVDAKINREIELEILRALLWDVGFLADFAHAISPSLFQPKYQPIAEAILDFWNQYGKNITPAALGQSLRFKLSLDSTPERYDQLVEVAAELRAKPETIDFVRDIMEQFIRYQRMENALVKSIDIFRESKRSSKPELLSGIDTAIARAIEPVVVDNPNTFLAEIEKRTDYRSQLAAGEITVRTVPSGIGCLDRLRGDLGIGPGELAMWVGSTGGGKSLALAMTAFTAARAGYDTLLVSLELSKDVIMDRLDSLATGEPIRNLVDKRNEVREKLEVIRDSCAADIKVEYMPGAKISDLRAVIERLRRTQNFSPKLLIVDYLDLLVSSHPSREGVWRDQANTTLELRNFAGKYEMAVWTAAQANRGGKRRIEEGEVITEADIAESYAKQTVADVIVSINQTKYHREQPEPRRITLYVVKNRNGIAGTRLEILSDFSRMQFYVGDWRPEDDPVDSKIFRQEQQSQIQ